MKTFKKVIGIILMVIGIVAFLLLMAAEVVLFKENNLPTSFLEWVGNLILPVLSVGVFFLGNFIRRK